MPKMLDRVIRVRLAESAASRARLRFSAHIGRKEKRCVLLKSGDPEVVACFERRMKLDRIQHQHRAGCHEENNRNCSAMEQPAQTHPFHWEHGHGQQ